MTAESIAPNTSGAKPEAAVAPRWRTPAISVAALFVGTLIIFWSGLGPNDSDKYIRTAIAWLENGPTLGADHWALRLPIVAPLALTFAALGPSEFASSIPNFLYAAGLVVVTFHYGRRRLGERAGTIAAALVAISAFFVVMLTELTVAGVEAFLVAFACWLVIDAIAEERLKLQKFALAGAVAGAAWLCREVTVYLPATLALAAFVFVGPRKSLAPLVALGAGFCAVVLVELLAYYFVAGDPLYRYKIDLGHRGNGLIVSDTTATLGLVGRAVQPFWYLLTSPTVTPIVILGALSWLSPSVRAAANREPARLAMAIFAIGALTNFVIAAYVLDLKSPTYFPIIVYLALLSLALFIAEAFKAGRKRLAICSFAGLAILNAAGADFRNYDEYAEPRLLADYVRRTGETVSTDHKTAIRTRMYLTLRGADSAEAKNRVKSLAFEEVAVCGLIFAATPQGAAYAFTAGSDWREQWRAEPRRRRATQVILSALGFSDSASWRLNEILKGAPPVIMYDAGPC